MTPEEQYRYQKRWRYDHAHGRPRTTPSQPIRAHIDALYMAGMSLSSIASAAGVSKSIVHRIFTGMHPTTRTTTATRILAVTAPLTVARPDDDETFVPRVGAVRRIQALQVLGWRHPDLHHLSGVRTHLILSQPGGWITWRNHARVAALYEQLSMTIGPSGHTARRARARGWAPPLAWDDDDLDDPHAHPHFDADDTDGEAA